MRIRPLFTFDVSLPIRAMEKSMSTICAPPSRRVSGGQSFVFTSGRRQSARPGRPRRRPRGCASCGGELVYGLLAAIGGSVSPSTESAWKSGLAAFVARGGGDRDDEAAEIAVRSGRPFSIREWSSPLDRQGGALPRKPGKRSGAAEREAQFSRLHHRPAAFWRRAWSARRSSSTISTSTRRRPRWSSGRCSFLPHPRRS